MNLEEFENNLIILGGNIDHWEDRKLADKAKKYLAKTKAAKEIHAQYNKLDDGLALLANDEFISQNFPEDFDTKLLERIALEDHVINETGQNHNNAIFFIFNPRIFIPALSICLVVALSYVTYKENFTSNSNGNYEDTLYAFADEVMEEVVTESEIELMEKEADSYEEILTLI